MTETPRVVVAGLGAIGCGLISETIKKPCAVSYAAAASKLYGQENLFGFDVWHERQMNFKAHYPKANLLSRLTSFRPAPNDIGVVATPPQHHLAVFDSFADMGFKRIIVEKPVGDNLEHFSAVEEKTKSRNIDVRIGLLRRYDSQLPDFISKIQNLEPGNIQYVDLVHTGGKGNAEFHLLDLVQIIATSLNPKLHKMEALATISLSSRSLKLPYEFLEMRILLDKGVVRLSNSAKILEFLPIVSDPEFETYRIIGSPYLQLRFKFMECIWNLLNFDNVNLCFIPDLQSVQNTHKMLRS